MKKLNSHEKRALRRYGFKLVNTITAGGCPRRVGGKRCLVGGSCLCLCDKNRFRLLDHCRMWRTREGNLVFTSEPYHVDLETLEKFRKEVRPLGLAVELLPYSPYYPGKTFLLCVSK